ncbi:MAG TPA: SIMPL domain-containing protein [Chitinophagaceae bacterium]|nr:SIMPL domain-containing protein [Chitinophagaceae bacterium]
MKNYIGAAIIALAVIIGLWVVGNAYKYKFKSAETISVTGLAEKDFTSDLIVWSGSFNRYGFELKTAYATLKQDEAAIKSYLNSRGIADSNIVFLSINITKNFQRKYDEKGNEISADFSGYTLTGNVRVESKDINRVEKLSREITELLEKGIELNSNTPEYYYTRLNELKIDLLAKASEDAKTRAETIARNSGGSLGGIKKATMGVFQITGKNANEDYSYGGAFNTSSKEKTASITLKVDYLAK